MVAREEARVGSAELEAAWKRADGLAAASTRPDVRYLHKKLQAFLRDRARQPNEEQHEVLAALAGPLLEEPPILLEQA
jgi:hypothetical protein